MSFSAAMRSRTSDLLERILALPFNRELAAGTLDPATFRHYVVQDSLYLFEYSRVLAALASKAPTAGSILKFAGSAQGAIIVERGLHERYFALFGIDPEDTARTPASPTCRAYTDFLHASVHRDGYAVGAAAILPCFRIYWDVGQRIEHAARDDNPYAAWIRTYADPKFGDSVAAAESFADAAHDAAGPAERSAMEAAYLRSAVYEWMFWDAAWRLESWPVAP